MIRLVTDSTTQLPGGAAEKYNIFIMPQIVIMHGKEYRDGVDISTEEFYRRLAEADALPTTTQPSPGDFQRVYERLVAEGADIISIHLPETLSGTMNSARQAAAMVEGARITPVATPWIASAQGFIVLEAARAIEAGASYDEVLELVDQLVPRQNLVFALDTLEYLHKGGRIGGAQALLGSLLRVKPILYLKDGRIEPLDRVRTWGRVSNRLLGLMADMLGPGDDPVHVGVIHSRNEEGAARLEEEVSRRFDVAELFTSEIGPVVGTHTGPGALGAAFYR
ncbi:MAG: DegV family protein [Anaerolineae bacterium]